MEGGPPLLGPPVTQPVPVPTTDTESVIVEAADCRDEAACPPEADVGARTKTTSAAPATNNTTRRLAGPNRMTIKMMVPARRKYNSQAGFITDN